MAVSEKELQELVRSVLARMGDLTPSQQEETGVYDKMEDAIAASARAQKEIRRMPLEFREKIIANIRKLTMENLQKLAEMGVAETGMGNIGHKIIKHQLVAEKTPGTEDLSTIAWSGDRGLTLVEQGPFGVIGAITPSTNPSETVLCNSIGMLAAGNSVVFNPHPSAIGVSSFAVQLVNQASIAAGGPANIATTVRKPTLETADIMYKSPVIPLLVATGGPGVVTAVLSTGKRAIGAGAGNPPVVVDETADIRKAAEDIINGATLDNNLPCIAEKEVVVVDKVADELMFYMEQCGAYRLTDKALIDKLAEMVLTTNKKGKQIVSRDWVGRDAYKFLNALGIDADASVKCIIFEAEEEHILVQTELMMPILGIVRAKDAQSAMEMGVRLEHGNRHSAHMHSKNVDHLTQFGQMIDTAIFVKNGPSYAALGFGGEGFPTFTIASRTGEGLTSAKTFTKSRRCVMTDALCIR
ncbi:aldehyde dehydrogenase family protein [Bianquea renquensis]|uniref:Aldehyde dehydrogenase EutE n=1 Tax=Bianquea renquensis TaxID=2763661 RepID=A0A926DRU2_9FIRM|nr:aldehyde dehydrogenase family protein [Bianquea renquensis]MBC8542632.1 aldehyde dehydrogenase EutE [Bianquea renquensis]